MHKFIVEFLAREDDENLGPEYYTYSIIVDMFYSNISNPTIKEACNKYLTENKYADIFIRVKSIKKI